MRLIILLSFLGSFYTLMQARVISGEVFGPDSTAMAGAECRLLSDGKLVEGTSAGPDGEFSLTTGLRTPLNLEISMTGFSSVAIIIEPGSRNLNIGKVFLDEGVILQEVTVTANRMISSKGHTIIYPSGADVRASSSSLSLFQKLPLAGLDANPINRTISVDGGSPVILINGVPSTMADVNALQPKDIEKIEYSRSTPARYLDSNHSGFINITLKKRSDGGQIYAWGRSAVTTAFMDANLSASYHQGSSRFTLQYNPSWRNYQNVYDNVTESFIAQDFRVNLEEHDRNPFNYHYHDIRLRYDFSPTSKTLFSVTFNATPLLSSSRTISHTVDSELGEYNGNSSTGSKDFTPSLDLFLHQDFNDKNSLEVQLVGTLNSSDYRRDNNYIFTDGTEKTYIMNVDSRRRSLISEISYIHTFNERTSISAGFQNTISHSRNTYLSSDYKPILTENNNYAYLRLGQRIGKFFLTLSTGAKMFWIRNDLNRRHFMRNISVAHLSWNINSQWSLQGTFRYTPVIPSLTALTDYPQQTTPYLVSNGNPNLKVSDNFVYSLAANFSYKKFQASYQFMYVDMRNSVINDITYMGNGLFLSRSVNARMMKTVQNDLSLRLSDIHGFGASLYLSVAHYHTGGADWSHRLT